MIHILTCPNGVQLNMTPFIIQLCEGKLTREQVQERIDFYKNNNQ